MSTSVETALCIRRSEHLHLAALVSTVGCSRLFVRQVCASWQLDQEQTDVVELLVSELASNAVVASGVTGPRPVRGLAYADLQLIGIRLLAFDDSLVVEVWDTSPRLPKLIEPSLEAEHGRGLQMVDSLSLRWGYYHARISGKVVWCQVALNASALELSGHDDADEFQRVLEALEAYPWDEHA
jgi:anti-sigma regulatory factor (Ser/Thr protein kinase)